MSAPETHDVLSGTVYVAAKFEEWPLVRALQHQLSLRGWRIGFDWTPFGAFPEEGGHAENAYWDVAGVRDAALLIAVLTTGRERGTFVELGYALGRGVRVLVIDATIEQEKSVFFEHPLVTYLKVPALIPPRMRQEEPDSCAEAKALMAHYIEKVIEKVESC